MTVEVKEFIDKETNTFSYVVSDMVKKVCLVIDPVLDFNMASGKIGLASLLKIQAYIEERELELLYILDSHVHADHISGAYSLKNMYKNAKIGIGKNITKVAPYFSKLYNLDLDYDFFDVFLEENKELEFGGYKIKTIFTPGHTPACSSYLIEKHLFTGDTLFMPDMGSGRCDFPGGSAKDLYHSVQKKLFDLPDETVVHVGHDYGPGGRELLGETTIKEQKEKNIHLSASIEESSFIKMREERDKTLGAPKLLLPALQCNIEAGKLPKSESNSRSYLKIPLTIPEENSL